MTAESKIEVIEQKLFLWNEISPTSLRDELLYVQELFRQAGVDGTIAARRANELVSMIEEAM